MGVAQMLLSVRSAQIFFALLLLAPLGCLSSFQDDTRVRYQGRTVYVQRRNRNGMIYTLDQARMTQLTCPKSALLWLTILTKIMLVVGVSDGNHQTTSDVAKKVSTTLITRRASATRTELKTLIFF